MLAEGADCRRRVSLCACPHTPRAGCLSRSPPLIQFVLADLPANVPALLIEDGAVTLIALGPSWLGDLPTRVELINRLLRKQAAPPCGLPAVA